MMGLSDHPIFTVKLAQSGDARTLSQKLDGVEVAETKCCFHPINVPVQKDARSVAWIGRYFGR